MNAREARRCAVRGRSHVGRAYVLTLRSLRSLAYRRLSRRRDCFRTTSFDSLIFRLLVYPRLSRLWRPRSHDPVFGFSLCTVAIERVGFRESGAIPLAETAFSLSL